MQFFHLYLENLCTKMATKRQDFHSIWKLWHLYKISFLLLYSQLILSAFWELPEIIRYTKRHKNFSKKPNWHWPNISTNNPDPGSGSKRVDPVFLLFLLISSSIKRHIMYKIKTYIIKIQSRNIIHDNRLLAVPKISFQMIPKNKDP